MATRYMHREVFLAMNGPGPWPCFECEEPLTMVDDFVVHHLDHDHDNNQPENLVSMHHPCHTKVHRQGYRASAESRRKMSLRRRGEVRSPEHRAAIAKASRERVWTPEMREKLRQKALGRKHTAAARRKMADAAKHLSENHRELLSAAGKLGAEARWGKQRRA